MHKSRNKSQQWKERLGYSSQLPYHWLAGTLPRQFTSDSWLPAPGCGCTGLSSRNRIGPPFTSHGSFLLLAPVLFFFILVTDLILQKLFVIICNLFPIILHLTSACLKSRAFLGSSSFIGKGSVAKQVSDKLIAACPESAMWYKSICVMQWLRISVQHESLFHKSCRLSPGCYLRAFCRFIFLLGFFVASHFDIIMRVFIGYTF